MGRYTGQPFERYVDERVEHIRHIQPLYKLSCFFTKGIFLSLLHRFPKSSKIHCVCPARVMYSLVLRSITILLAPYMLYTYAILNNHYSAPAR